MNNKLTPKALDNMRNVKEITSKKERSYFSEPRQERVFDQ
jgi:hypothetical protein